MNNDEIAKLAREYAEEIYPNLSDKIISLRTQEIKDAERLIRFFLRTHCIVSKEEVRKMHDNELEFAQFYQRKANSCINQHCRIDYETSRDIAKSRAKMLESLFDVETFKNSEE